MENGGQTPQLQGLPQGDPKKPADGGNGQDSQYPWAGPSLPEGMTVEELEANLRASKSSYLDEETRKKLESGLITQADIDYGLTDELRQKKLESVTPKAPEGGDPSKPSINFDPTLLHSSVRNAGMFDFAFETLGHKSTTTRGWMPGDDPRLIGKDVPVSEYKYDPNQPYYIFDENYNIVDVEPRVKDTPNQLGFSGPGFAYRLTRMAASDMIDDAVAKPDQPGFKGLSFDQEHGGDPNYRDILTQLEYPFRVEQGEPDWLADMPTTEEEVQEYADRRLGELVPEELLSGMGPSVRVSAIGVTEEDIKSDIERRNRWVDKRNEAIESAISTIDSELAEMSEKTAAYVDFVQSNNEHNSRVFQRLMRDATPESLNAVFGEGGSNSVSDLRLSAPREITYYLPTGATSRAQLSIRDLFDMRKPNDEWVWGYEGDGLPSKEELYTMIDLWIEDNPQMFDSYERTALANAREIVKKRDEDAIDDVTYENRKEGLISVDWDKNSYTRKIKSKRDSGTYDAWVNERAESMFMKEKYELAFRFMTADWVKNDVLRFEGMKPMSNRSHKDNDERSLTSMETIVFEDLSSDPYMYKLMEKAGFSSGAYLINIDHDPVYIGRQKADAVRIGNLEVFSAQTVDQWNALTGPGLTQAGIAAKGVATTTGQLAVEAGPSGMALFMGYGSLGFQLGLALEWATDYREDIAPQAMQWLERDYDAYKARKDIELQREIRELNVYSYTRDQARLFGYLSGYTMEEINDMSIDVQANMLERNYDEMTAIFGLFDAQEYRQALISVPTSMIASAAAAVTTAATGGNVVAGAAVASYFMGSAVYQEEFYNARNNPDLANLTREEKQWMALTKAGNEAIGEFVGNVFTLGAGKFITGMGVRGGAKLTSAYVLGDSLGKKALRVFSGMVINTGLALPEEYLAESFTEYLNIVTDDYYKKLNDGEVSSFSEYKQKTDFYGIYTDNIAQIQEAGRMGMAGAGVQGSMGVAAGYGRAAAEYMFDRETFYSKAMVQLVSSETVTKEMDIFERREYNKKLKEFQKLSPSEMMSEQGQAMAMELADIISETHEMGAVAAADLRGLAKVNPAMFADSYTADMQAKQLEAEGGNYTQDENGRWRLNGRFIADPTKTRAYKKNQRMSDDAKASFMERVKAIRAGIRQNRQFGRYTNGLQTVNVQEGVSRMDFSKTNQNWREEGKGSYQEITTESDVSQMFADEQTRKMFEGLQSLLNEGESIVVHNENLSVIDGIEGSKNRGLYVEDTNGGKQMHVLNPESAELKDKETVGEIESARAEAGYIVLHEIGHRDTENKLQDNETRAKIADEVIERNWLLASDLLDVYAGKKGIMSKEAVIVEMSKLDEKTRAVIQRELVVNHMDQAARGRINGISNSLVSRVITAAGIKTGLISENSMAALSAKYMDNVRAAGLPTGMKTKSQFAEAQRFEQQKAAVEEMTQQEFENSVEEAGNGLASKNINFFRGGTVYYEFNRNVPIAPNYELGPRYRLHNKQFNDYFHLVNWWRQQTGNGLRQTVGTMYYVVDGVQYPIRPTDKWIKKKKDGSPVRMRGALSTGELKVKNRLEAADLHTEYLVQRSSLAQEVGELVDNNFSFDGFALDYHSFFGPNDKPGTFSGLVNAKKNILGLLEKGYTEADFRAMLGDRQYIISARTNPELFNLGENVKYESFAEASARVTEEAAELGVEAWQLLPETSKGYNNRVEDLIRVSREDLLYAMKKLHEYKENGSGDFTAEVLASKELPRRGKKDVAVVQVSDYADFKETYGDLVEAGILDIVVVPSDNKQLIEDAKNNKLRTHRWAKYDRKKAGEVSWPIRNSKGEVVGTMDVYQSGGVFGLLELARITNGQVLMGPSHVNKTGHNSFVAVGEEVNDKHRDRKGSDTSEMLYQDIALRGPKNSLRSAHTTVDLLKYLKAFVEANPETAAAAIEALQTTLNESVTVTSSPSIAEHQGEGSIESAEFVDRSFSKKIPIHSSFTEILEDLEGVYADEYGIKIQSTQGLLNALDALVDKENFDVIDELGFPTRAELVKKISGSMVAGTNGQFLTVEEILDVIDEPKFKGLKENTIILTVEMDPNRLKGLDMRKKKPQSEEEATFYENASFKHGTTVATRTDENGQPLATGYTVILPQRTTTIDSKYGEAASGEGSTGRAKELPSNLLASRRLPGRIYVEGNTRWERSNATAYGMALAAATRKFQDSYSDVLLLQQDVEVFKKAKVAESQDFEMAMDIYYGKVRYDLELLEKRVGAIQERMRDAGITSQQLSNYLYAKHAAERNDHILKRHGIENGSGMTNEEADRLIDELETAEMLEIANMAYEIIEDTRKTMVEGGLETRQAVNKLRETFSFYVPLNGRAMDEMNDLENEYPTGGAGMAIYGPPVRRAWGRKSKTGHNLLSNIVMQNAATKQRARKDQAMMALYQLVKENPNENVWRIVSPNQPYMRRGKPVSAKELKNSEFAVPIRVNGEQHFIVFKDASYAKALNGMNIEQLTAVQRVMTKYMGFLRNSYTVWNPGFFIGNFARDMETALMNAAAEIEREGGILQGYGINVKDFNKKLSKTAWDSLKALFAEAGRGKKLSPEMQKYLEEWKAAGGRTGWSYSETLDKVVSDLNKQTKQTRAGQVASKAGSILSKMWMNPKDFFRYVEGLNEAFENAIRLAAYIEARKAGMTANRAAQLSKNITVNFNKSGEYTAGLNSWWLFFNASIQGTSRFFRTMRRNEMYVENESDPGATKKWRKRISTTSKIAAGMTIFSALQTLLNISISGEDEDGILYYDKIPDYVKERNWVIMVSEDKYIKIPLPYGFNVFANTGLALAEMGSGHRDVGDAAAFLAFSSHASFSPVGFGNYDGVGETATMAVTPTVLKPFAETFLFNRTYFGSQAYREQSDFGPPVPEYRLAYKSPEWLIELSKYLNEASGGTSEIPGDIDFNPDKIYYLLTSLTGGAGQFIGDIYGLGEKGYQVGKKNIDRALKSDDFIESLLTVEEDEKVNVRINEIPLLKIIYGEPSKFYDYDLYKKNKNELETLIREVKKGTSTDTDYTGVPELEWVLDHHNQVLDELNERRKEAQKRSDYVDRHNELDRINEAQRKEMMMFNAAYEVLRNERIK